MPEPERRYLRDFLGCIGDEEGNAPLAVWCTNLGTNLTIELLTDPVTSLGPPVALPSPPPLRPIVTASPPAGTWPNTPVSSDNYTAPR